MKISLIPVNAGTDSLKSIVALSKKAEEVGLESVWTFEHAIVPMDYESKYPYSADGKMGVLPETNFVDPLIALATVAAHTERLRLGTGVNILSQSNPLMLAKQAASLDFVSQGRLMLGVGIGWLREEFRAMGVPFERRGARFDDAIQAMRKVWSGEVVEHKSEFLDWTGFKSYPLPVQDPFPIIIGGSKGKAFERIAKYGQGWYAPTLSVAQLEPLLVQLGDACAREGRDIASVEISCMWVPGVEGPDVAKQYEDMGVDRLIIPLQALGGGSPVDNLDRLAEEVLRKL